MSIHIRRATLASALMFGLVGQAFAHAQLKAAAPALDGTVASAPTELDLDFCEGVNLRFSGVEGQVQAGPPSR